MSAALLCHSGAARAQDHVSVRSADHKGYSRLVFDWDKPVSYKISRKGDDGLDIAFQAAAGMDASGVNTKDGTILGLQAVSGKGENLDVLIKIPAGSRYREFMVGSRLVVDVYGDVTPDGKTKAQAEPEKPKAEKTAATVAPAAIKAQPAPAETKTLPEQAPEATPPVITPAVTDVQPDVAAAVAEPEVPPHNINISSTNVLNLALFRRNGYLWMVLDRSDVSVPPQLSGPESQLFSNFEKVPSDVGTVYRLRIPAGTKISPQGDGLVWKIRLSSNESQRGWIEPERQFSPGEDIRGGTLFWPMQRVTRVVKITDPDTGETILAGTVDHADQSAGPARGFVDVDLLDSPIGIAALSKADDVEMTPVGNGVQISRPGGLVLSRVRDIPASAFDQAAAKPDHPASAVKRIFDFDRWLMGGIQALRENQQILLSGMASKDKTGKVQDLLMLAKMSLANDRGQEAMGFLNFAAAELPDIAQSPEFLALRGAAEAMSGKFELALGDFSIPALKDYGELDYWRAYTLAGLEDWQQAKDVMPQNFDLLKTYPLRIQEKLILKLAELELRFANTTAAGTLLGMLDARRDALEPWTQAGIDYLKGEKDRQANNVKKAESAWKALGESKDDLYRVKANLALTMLQLQNKEISPAQAIDRLEGLRYHWRGDELEAQVNFMLGRLYYDDGRFQKAFTILKDAVGIVPDADITKEIAKYMAANFRDLFLSDKLNKVSPVDAATIYHDFSELMPAGDDGNRIMRRLAERMVDADLLDRAAAMLKDLADRRLSGKDAADVDVRLAAIDLLNDDPQSALAALDKGSGIYATLPADAAIGEKQHEIELLRARALSKMGKTADALDVLNKMPPSADVSRLRADISWNAGKWADAAEALHDLILSENIDASRPLTQKQADMILNRAVALNLAGDRVELENMKNKFGDMMSKTSRAKMFDVVTRQRTGSLLSDRESITALVSEVDLFKDFLDSYRADTKPSN